MTCSESQDMYEKYIRVNALQKVLATQTSSHCVGQTLKRHTSSSSDRVELRIIVFHTDLRHLLDRHIILVCILACRRGVSVSLLIIKHCATNPVWEPNGTPRLPFF